MKRGLFKIFNGTAEATVQGAARRSNDDPMERVERMVTSSNVVLLMKGSPGMPRCGFSANTVAILDRLGVAYSSFDVLEDQWIRSAAKEYAAWPTFPQVWVRGELIGGHDIVTEMYTSGELQMLVEGLGR